MTNLNKWLIITFLTTISALNINDFVSNEIKFIKNSILKFVFVSAVTKEEIHYKDICTNLNFESNECYNDCLHYLFPLSLFKTNSTNNTNELMKVFNWYEMSSGPIGYNNVGNPSMCKYKDGTYCSTPLKQDRYTLQSHGCCIPGSCIGTDAIKILQSNDWCYKSYVMKFNKFIDFKKFELQIHNICEPLPVDFNSYGFWIVCAIFCIFVFLVIISSIIYQLNGVHLSSFSMQTSFKLFTTRRIPAKSKFNFFDGMRVISIVHIIFGHGWMETLFGINYAIANREIIAPIDWNTFGFDINPKPFEYSVNHWFWNTNYYMAKGSVETFFYLSGCLSCFSLLNQLKNMKSAYYIWIPFAYVSRLLRLMPMLIFALLIQMFVVDQLLYGYNITSRNDNYISCSSCWYKIIFMYRNLTNPNRSDYSNLCLYQTWYVLCDFQCFLLLPWIILIFKYKQMYAFIVSLLPVFTCIICRIYYSNYYHFYMRQFAPAYHTIHDEQFNKRVNFDKKPWAACSSYFIGVFTMLLISYINKNKKDFRIKSNAIYFSLIFSSLFIFYCLILWPYQDVKHMPYNRWSLSQNQAFYSLFNTSWSIALSIMTFAFYFKTNEISSIIHTLLSLEIFQPLAKLVYLMFLLHVMLYIIIYTSFDMPIYFENWITICYCIAITVMTVIISWILWFVVENPITNLIKTFLKKIWTKKRNHQYHVVHNETATNR